MQDGEKKLGIAEDSRKFHRVTGHWVGPSCNVELFLFTLLGSQTGLAMCGRNAGTQSFSHEKHKLTAADSLNLARIECWNPHSTAANDKVKAAGRTKIICRSKRRVQLLQTGSWSKSRARDWNRRLFDHGSESNFL
jgi:hypothetical protein